MRVKVTHRKQLAGQKPLHQTIPVIRSIKSVQLMYWLFYFTDFFAKQGGSKATVKKMLQWSIFRESVDES